jgi:nucleoporin POM152
LRIKLIALGDQAEIVFTFTGTPPFSFTYTRSVKRGKVDVVLETQVS